MAYSRKMAFCLLFSLIALLSFLTIFLVLQMGIDITRGANVDHESGVIVQMHTNSFVLKTANGDAESFLCVQHCLSAQYHMERHMREDAKTDVYYVRQGNQLLAVDVD